MGKSEQCCAPWPTNELNSGGGVAGGQAGSSEWKGSDAVPELERAVLYCMCIKAWFGKCHCGSGRRFG